MEQLELRVKIIEKLFKTLMQTNSRLEKEYYVEALKLKHPKIVNDLNFCFEVLAGKHKVGYTAYKTSTPHTAKDIGFKTIKEFYNNIIKTIKTNEVGIHTCMCLIPENLQDFFVSLTNREYKLGFSNHQEMKTNLSPMLAKNYLDVHKEQYYYIQEKLDGNRCIAYYNTEQEKWCFQSRSGKPMKLNFDMSWCGDTTLIFDGEVMTLGKAGTRDFNRTSGAINGKYTNKSDLHYYIYDIIDDELTYKKRKAVLEYYMNNTDMKKDCSILPVLDFVPVYLNTDYNWQLDEWLDKIVAEGGEGIILRDPDSVYKHTRTEALLKYKKLQTMDLRIIGWNEGNGKYEGAIGSFICETDDGSIKVNVAGMNDNMRFSNPNDWIGTIIEVAYFDKSKSKTNNYTSLRFPRLKRVRFDKNETSIH